MFSFHWKLSKEGRKRFFDEFLPLLHNTKHEVLGKEEAKSWYLVYIGTRPGSRGKGYAKALIENITQKVCWFFPLHLISWEAGRRTLPRTFRAMLLPPEILTRNPYFPFHSVQHQSPSIFI